MSPAPEPRPAPSEPRDWSDWSGITRTCPRCGTAVRTLGDTCPACGKTFAARGIVDHLPLDSDAPWFDRLLLVLGIWVVVGFVWLAIKHPIAAIVVFGAAFVLMLVGVAVNNLLIDRANRGRPRDGGG